MAKPRKSRRLCGSVAVFSVFNILFSQRHYVTRLQAGSRPCANPLLRPADRSRAAPRCQNGIANMYSKGGSKRWSAGDQLRGPVLGEPVVCAIATEVSTSASNAIVVINFPMMGLRVGAPHDHGNGKLDHKVRQTSRFVQTLQHRAHRRCLAALFTGR